MLPTPVLAAAYKEALAYVTLEEEVVQVIVAS